MPNIVMPVRSNLWLQILLEVDLYFALLCTISYSAHAAIYIVDNGVEALMVFLLLLTVEIMRIFAAFMLNLISVASEAKCLLATVLVLCCTQLAGLCYSNNNTTVIWLKIIWYYWQLLIGLEMLIILFDAYPYLFAANRSHRWP